MTASETMPLSSNNPEQQRHSADYEVYLALRRLAEESKHGERFDIRDFTDDKDGVLRLDRAFLPIHNDGAEIGLAVDTFAPMLALPENFKALSSSISEVLLSPRVAEHRDNGGSVAFVPAPHLTYADLPVAAGAAAMLGREVARNQTVFIHRQVGLYEVNGVEVKIDDATHVFDHVKIVDDGIMRLSNVIQTFPESQSGMNDAFLPYRDTANKMALRKYLKLIQAGGHIFWLAVNGTEAKPDDDHQELLVQRPPEGGASLLYIPNRREKRLMTIPFAIECNPFKKGGGFEPHNIPYKFGEPQIINNAEEVQVVMENLIVDCNDIKRPDTYPIRYESEEEFRARTAALAV